MKHNGLKEILKNKRAPGIVGGAKSITDADLNRAHLSVMEDFGAFKKGGVLNKTMKLSEGAMKERWDQAKVKHPTAQKGLYEDAD